MPKIKLNINNSKKAENSSEKELIERARMQIEEKRMSSDTIPQKTKSKIGLFVFISAALIIAASAATFVVVNKNNQQPYKKFIPKSTIISASLSPEKLNNVFNTPNPLVFPHAISKIKTEATVLGADTEKILSQIKKDIIIASVKTLDNSLSSIIIVQLPDCWELAMLYLAIARAGALISAVPMQWRESELRYVGELTQARALITATVASSGPISDRFP